MRYQTAPLPERAKGTSLARVPWLPDGFRAPERLDLPTGHHLRPIRAADVDIDYPAVMGSRERLWARYGEVWGWPPATMTLEQDRDDLARHEAEAEANESFNYAVLDARESRLLGCVYLLDPPDGESDQTHDALVSWWVVDEEAGGPLECTLGEAVPRWLAAEWPFTAIRRHP